MSIIELYELHINSSPNGAEIHHLFTSFEIGSIVISNPDPEMDKVEKIHRASCENACKEWILKNSKLTPLP